MSEKTRSGRSAPTASSPSAAATPSRCCCRARSSSRRRSATRRSLSASSERATSTRTRLLEKSAKLRHVRKPVVSCVWRRDAERMMSAPRLFLRLRTRRSHADGEGRRKIVKAARFRQDCLQGSASVRPPRHRKTPCRCSSASFRSPRTSRHATSLCTRYRECSTRILSAGSRSRTRGARVARNLPITRPPRRTARNLWKN